MTKTITIDPNEDQIQRIWLLRVEIIFILLFILLPRIEELTNSFMRTARRIRSRIQAYNNRRRVNSSVVRINIY